MKHSLLTFWTKTRRVKKSQWELLDERRAKTPPYVRCLACGKDGFAELMEPHHPCGSLGRNALKVVWLHPQCHKWIHKDPELATRYGFLWPYRSKREVTDEEWDELLVKMKEDLQ